jgi:hypothetical protein
LALGLSALAAHLGPQDAARLRAQAADTLTRAMTQTKRESLNRFTPLQLADGLSAVLAGVDRPELSKRSTVALAAIGTLAGTGHPVVTLASLVPALEPLPCCLSTSELVELLKQPTCIGAARRIILGQLGNRYRRPFADHWQFVRFAQEQHLGLDFTGPPKRPVRSPWGENK